MNMISRVRMRGEGMKRITQALIATTLLINAGCSINLADLEELQENIKKQQSHQGNNKGEATNSESTDARPELPTPSNKVAQTAAPEVIEPSVAPSLEPVASVLPPPTPQPPEAAPSVEPVAQPPVVVPSAAPSSSVVVPSAIASTAPVTPPAPEPTPSSPFVDFEAEDQADLDAIFTDELTGETPTIQEELEVYDDLFETDSELTELLGAGLTTDGGPLLFTTAGFSIQMLTTLPKAWKRNNRQRIAQRVKLRRIAPGRMSLFVANRLQGEFLIDIDGTQNNPTPGTKPMNERMFRRFELKRTNGKWAVDALSMGVVVPQNPNFATLAKLIGVKASTVNGNTIDSTTPLKPILKTNLPTINSGQTYRFEAKIAPANTPLLPRAFVFLHGFGQRVRMKDNGQNGDQQLGDGVFTAVVTAPAQFNKPNTSVGIDLISTPTMADETSNNYQSINWFTTFKVN